MKAAAFNTLFDDLITQYHILDTVDQPFELQNISLSLV